MFYSTNCFAFILAIVFQIISGKTCPPRIFETGDLHCEYNGIPTNCSEPAADGTIATLKCKKYYESNIPAGQPPIQCKDGTWDYPIMACTPICGTVVPSSLIVGQTQTQENSPWHVAVYKKIRGKIEYICGGSIIGTSVILSAAYCFTDSSTGQKEPAENFLIAAGKYYKEYNDVRDTYAQKYEVRSIGISNHYRGTQSNFSHDLAVIVLKENIVLSHWIQPVCVDLKNSFEDRQLTENSIGKVAGWGIVHGENAERESDELKELSVPYINKETCLKTVPLNFVPFVTEDKFCAGYLNGSSVCSADGGGGLVFQDKESNRYYIRGVLSLAPVKGHSCDTTQIAVYTRISQFITKPQYLKQI